MKVKLSYIIVLLLVVIAVSSCSGSRGLYGGGRQKCGCPSHRGMVG